jgi:hypothetical protein
MKEMFVDFAEVERITGSELASTILCCLNTWGYHYQTYEGSVTMALPTWQGLG